MDSLPVGFGRLLRDLRRQRRLSLDDVERLTAGAIEPVTRSLLSRLENGRARLSALKLLALGQAYGIRLEALAARLEELHRPAAAAHDEPSRERLLGSLRRGDRRAAAADLDRLGARCGAEGMRRLRLELSDRLLAERRGGPARDLLEPLLVAEPDDPHALAGWGRAAAQLGLLPLAASARRALERVPTPQRDDLAASGSDPAALERAIRRLDAELHVLRAQRAAAVDAWLAVFESARATQHGAEAVEAALELSRIALDGAKADAAVHWARWAERVAEPLADPALRAMVALELGRAHRADQRLDLARRAWTVGRTAARVATRSDLLFAIYAELWRAACSERDQVAARATLRSLRPLLRTLDAVPSGVADVLAAVDVLTPGVSEAG